MAEGWTCITEGTMNIKMLEDCEVEMSGVQFPHFETVDSSFRFILTPGTFEEVV